MQFPWSKQVQPTADSIAADQLQQAERDLLAAEKDAEHYRHQVALLKERVARLKARSYLPKAMLETAREFPGQAYASKEPAKVF